MRQTSRDGQRTHVFYMNSLKENNTQRGLCIQKTTKKNIVFHISASVQAHPQWHKTSQECCGCCCWCWWWHRFAWRNDRDEEIWSLKWRKKTSKLTGKNDEFQLKDDEVLMEKSSIILRAQERIPSFAVRLFLSSIGCHHFNWKYI